MNKNSVIRWDLIFGLASVISLAVLIIMLYNDFGRHIFKNKSDNEITTEDTNVSDVHTTAGENSTVEPMDRPASAGGVVVCIDAGRGGNDIGSESKGLKEKNINLEIAKLVKRDLEAVNVNVVMTRSTDIAVTDGERVKICNDAKAELLLSIRTNAYSGAGVAAGSEAWVHSSNPRDAIELSKLLLDRMNKDAGFRNRGYKVGMQGTTKENYYLNAHSNCTSCVFNVGFITDPDDAKRMTTDVETTARAIANGIIDYLIQAGKF